MWGVCPPLPRRGEGRVVKKRLLPERRLAQRFAPVPAKLKIACETGASLPFAGEDAETQRDSPGTREVPGLIWNSECVASDAFSLGLVASSLVYWPATVILLAAARVMALRLVSDFQTPV